MPDSLKAAVVKTRMAAKKKKPAPIPPPPNKAFDPTKPPPGNPKGYGKQVDPKMTPPRKPAAPDVNYLTNFKNTPLNVGKVTSSGVTFKDYQTKKVTYDPAGKAPKKSFYVREDKAKDFPKTGKNQGNPRPYSALPDWYGKITKPKANLKKGKAITARLKEVTSKRG